ncbi:hypothetical protein FD723_30825 [Nostoc sp. C052]|uniref:hypothetical protein n=1 Tax=Nostoc sp. C052 TaxID=2576902 RepID=UPI0015C2D1E3|nr:hypothetical protein [Nostoc sp. C052]QLE44388.1 hypothetical protein FD723_30825 [Nostoc sp. C052]
MRMRSSTQAWLNSSPSAVNKLSSESTDLRIWWDKGSNLEEDEALNRIVVEQISLEQATNEAIAPIKQIFDQWQ